MVCMTKKVIGLASICIAVGMLLMFLLNNRFTGLILMGAFALVGYFALFCE